MPYQTGISEEVSSGRVGLCWGGLGKDWGQWSKANRRLPLRFTGQENRERPGKDPKCFTEMSGGAILGSIRAFSLELSTEVLTFF
jgi:hypothetical protein